MLAALNVKKNFGAVQALKGASLGVKPGEIRALLGANGSGKSTFVKVLGGLNRPDHAEITLDGKPVHIRSPRDARRLGIAVAYQDLSLVPRMSVADNILLGHEPRGAAGSIAFQGIQERAGQILHRLDVFIEPDALVSELDASTKSMVEVAKALSWNPRILILDEVTASLHHDEVKSLFRLLKELQAEGLGIIFVSHRLDEVFALCETASVLRSGESVADLNLAEVDEGDLVYHMTGKRVEQRLRDEQAAAEALKRAAFVRVEDLRVPPTVKGVSLEVHTGEIVGIAGLQGQGQSEFLRAIYGAIPFHHGSFLLDGKPVRFHNPAAAIRAGLGFISGDREKDGIFPVRPVAENLHIARFALKRIVDPVHPGQMVRSAVDLIRQLGVVTGSPNHPANSLSGGNQQKLIVGRWLMVRPRLLLLDDPTKGVDITSRREIHELLRQMTQQGTTVVISSSDNEELLEVADRIYVFYEGRAVEELSGAERTEENVISAMLGVQRQAAGGMVS